MLLGKREAQNVNSGLGALHLVIEKSLRSNLQLMAFIGGLFLAFRVGVAVVRRNSSQARLAFRTELPILLFAIAYAVLNIVVLSAPMAHRH